MFIYATGSHILHTNSVQLYSFQHTSKLHSKRRNNYILTNNLFPKYACTPDSLDLKRYDIAMDISNNFDSNRRRRRHELFFCGGELPFSLIPFRMFFFTPLHLGSQSEVCLSGVSFVTVGESVASLLGGILSQVLGNSCTFVPLLFSEVLLARNLWNIDFDLINFLLSSSTTRDSTASSIFNLLCLADQEACSSRGFQIWSSTRKPEAHFPSQKQKMHLCSNT